MRRLGYLWVWCKALSTGAPYCFESTQQWSLTKTTAFCQKPRWNNCFFYFQVGVFYQWPLINLQQISFTVVLYYLKNESLCLPQKGEVGCLHATSAPTATIRFCLPLSYHISLYPSLCRGWPFSPHVIHTSSDYLLPKLNQNFPFLKVWFFHMSIGLHLADPFCNPISYSLLFWLMISLTSTFLSLPPSLVRKINFIWFCIFSASQKLNNISHFFLIVTIYWITLKKTTTMY